MRRAVTAAVVLAAAVLIAPASAIAQAAPAPGELWSEFPLDPNTETTPAGQVPGQVIEPTAQPQAAESDDDLRVAGVLILVTTAVAAGAGIVGRRRVGRRQQSDRMVEPKRGQKTTRTFERPVPSVAGGGSAGSLAVANWGTSTATRPAEQLEQREHETASATHEVCEIACWRGYVAWQFYVELESPDAPSLYSPYFRAPGKGTPEQTDAALRAHALLVEKLGASGWEPEGYGGDWFSERFQRATR